MSKDNIITIDGPSGAGKGTIAKNISQSLKWHLLDSGAIYRVLALLVVKNNIDIKDKDKDKDKIITIAKSFNLEFRADKDDELLKVYLNSKEVSKELRLQKCAEIASQLAVIKEIRKVLLQKQRDFYRMPGLVADGRDMGTVVFPNAIIKIFLTASPEERAKRRFKQLQLAGQKGNIHKIFSEIKKRDERDLNRQTSPLIPAKNAIVIDSTNLSIDEVITKIMTLVNTKMD